MRASDIFILIFSNIRTTDDISVLNAFRSFDRKALMHQAPYNAIPATDPTDNAKLYALCDSRLDRFIRMPPVTWQN